MGVTFLQPWVWLLAAAVALPIAIHFLARDRSRRVPFPSLRFLETTRLSAVTRRVLQDWPLLLLRVAIVLVAVAALAGPIFLTPARRTEWASRVARAIVLDDRTASPDDELRSASPGIVLARERVGDAVRDAVRWLAHQERATREIVVLSSFTRGAVGPADFVDVPAGVGIRLVRTSDGTVVRDRSFSRLELRDSGLVRVTERLELLPDETRTREEEVRPLDTMPIRVSAAPDARADAEAALRAVLRRGIRLPPAGLLRDIEVPWTGEVDALARAIDAEVRAPLDAWEPEAVSDAELAAMARPATTDGPSRPADRGDRRTLWAVVALLLVLEMWVRQGGAWT
ncbi:MAG: BatA domain-containing protein [Vicinamibacterales bacterium]